MISHFVLSIALVSAIVDWKSGKIPNWITYPFIFFGILYTVFTFPDLSWLWIPTLIFISGILFNIASDGQLGGGDIKLLTGISLWQPIYQGEIFILPVIIFSIISCILYMVAQRKKLTDVRFGPFIGVGVLLSYSLLNFF